MIRSILIALIFVLSAATLVFSEQGTEKEAKIYKQIIEPFVANKVGEHIQEVYPDTVYHFVQFGINKVIQSEKDKEVYLFYVRVYLKATMRDKDIGYKYSGSQGMELVMIANSTKILYFTTAGPYWLHKKEEGPINERITNVIQHRKSFIG